MPSVDAQPLVSVVLPVYNGEKYLRTAVESVFAQDYHPIELVAVDDGSTDTSTDILESYRDRLRHIRQTNQGVSAARNAGMKVANGELICFLDQDDWWLPSKISAQVAAMRQDPRVGLVHTDVEHFDDVMQRCIPRFNENRSELLIGDCYEQLLLGNAIFSSTVMVRASILAVTGAFDTRIETNTVQDYDLWLRFAKVSRLAYISERLVFYRLHPNQGMWKVRDSHAQLVSVLERAVGPSERLGRGPLREHLGALYSELGGECADCGDMEEARRCYAQGWRLRSARRDLFLLVLSTLPLRAFQLVRRGRSEFCRRFGRVPQSRVPVWTGRVNNGLTD